MSQSSSPIVTSNRQSHLGYQSGRVRSYCSENDDTTDEKVKGSGRNTDEEEDSWRGTGSAAGTTTTIVEEEIIEQLTTFEGPPDSLSLTRGDEDSSSIVSHRSYISGGESSSSANYYHQQHQHFNNSHQELHVNNYDLNLSGSVLKVPFPELGVDVVDINYCSLLPSEDLTSENETTRITDVKSWEENWLFQKKKKKREEEEEVPASQFAFTDLHLIDGPVNMYIPFPSQSQSFLDHLPLEDLEELSERGSVISLVFSSDSEELTQESSADKQERDETSNFSLDLLEEQILSMKIQGSTSDEKKNDSSNLQPSNGFLQFLMTHDSSDLSYNSSPKTTLKSSHKYDEGRKNEIVNTRAKSGSSILLTESQVLQPPSFVRLKRRVTQCPKSDPCFVLKPFGASVQPNILVQFCCRVKGSRPIQVAWFKGERLLNNNETFRIFCSGNEFVIEITDTKFDHSDTYSCCVYNANGQQWTDFQLEVNELKEPVKSSSPSISKESKPFKCSNPGQKSATPVAIITRTWAERNESISSRVIKDDESKSIPRHENSMACNFQVSSSGTSNMGVDLTANSIVSMGKGVPRQESVTSDRPIVYSSTPTPKNDQVTGDEVDRSAFFGKVKLGDQKEFCEGEKNKITSVSNETESGMLNTLHKRDCSFSSFDALSMGGSMERNRQDESMNGFEEKIYESSKFFTVRHPPSKPTLTKLERSSAGESGCESISPHQEGSSNSRGVGSDGESDLERRQLEKTVKAISPSAVGPSVRKLVRRFSRKENGLERRSTFTSSSSIHDEGRGSGIRVHLRSPGIHRFEVHSLTARNIGREFHEKKQPFPLTLNKMGSMSLYDIDQVPKSLSPGSGSSDMTATTDSPTNDGYISDDSTISETKVKFGSLKTQPVSANEIHPSSGTTITQTVTEKATFWQKRTENRLPLSNSSMNEDFTNAHFL